MAERLMNGLRKQVALEDVKVLGKVQREEDDQTQIFIRI